MEFPWAAETHKKALVLAVLCSSSSPWSTVWGTMEMDV